MIIAHRGYWKSEPEKNSIIAFQRALDNGFGIETDIRDCAGKLVISHNPPLGNEITIEEFFSMYCNSGVNSFLALNIKADGLQDMLKPLIQKYNISNYFFFDMSVCDTIPYIERGLKIASRKSEFEPFLPFYKNSSTIWIDYFKEGVDISKDINEYVQNEKYACIVSPELHGFPSYKIFWENCKPLLNKKTLICTDNPEEASKFFK